MNNLHRPGGKSKNFTYVHFTCRNFQPMRHNIFLSLWPLYRTSCWALSLVKIEFGHLRSRRRIELLWWWCHAKQCIPNPSLTKLFCPFFLSDTEESDFSSFSAEEDWSIINRQQYCICTFSSSPFRIEQWQYFVPPAECVQEIVHMNILCTSFVYFSCSVSYTHLTLPTRRTV